MSRRSSESLHRVWLSPPTARDATDFIALARQSEGLNRGLASPPATAAQFARYLDRLRAADFEGFLLRRTTDDLILGSIAIDRIARGNFQSGFLGYQIFAPFARQGYMAEGLALALQHAFRRLRLHRLEANIQPHNTASIALVSGLGFRREGYSPRYLKIRGRWRDHERWAILAEEWREEHRLHRQARRAPAARS